MVRGYACHPDSVDFVRSVLLKNVADATSKRGKRLYLKRAGSTSVAGRKILNLAEVEDTFRRAGFQMIDPGGLSIDEQVRLFVHPRCKGLVEDFEEVTFKPETSVIDKERDSKRTHLSDALGYLIWQECRPQVVFGEQGRRLL